MDNFWENKKVLVTGGRGFLGKYIVDTLISKKAYIRVMDFKKPSTTIGNIEFFTLDIQDTTSLSDLCEGIDYTFHLAAIPSIARRKPGDYYNVNVKGTRNLLNAAYKNGVKKVVYVSSSTVYGIPSYFPLKEDSPLRPLGKYGRSKLAAENECRRFINKGMDITIIRPRVIIGPGRIGIFSILFNQLLEGGNIYILGKGNNLFQFTHVVDMVNACLRAAELAGADLFNIGSSQVKPVREELADLIRHAKSKSRLISLPALPARFLLRALNILGISPLVDEQFMIADKNFKLDTTHAQQRLGWTPHYSNIDSLIQAYDWYKSHITKIPKQYKSVFSVFGKFKHSHMGGFQG